MPVNFSTLFEDLVRNESHRFEYDRLLSEAIQTLAQGGAGIQWIDGVPYITDPGRSKNISLNRPEYTAGYYGLNQSSRYLRLDGVTTSANSGILLPRDAVITGLWGKSRSTGNWSIEIRRNGNPITLVSVNVVGSVGSDPELDVDLDAGDFIQFYMVGSGVDHPIAGVEIAWRAI